MDATPIADLPFLKALPRLVGRRLSVRGAGVFDPGSDLVPSGPPSRTIVIASSPRSGSSLLAEALTATGKAGVPDEYFSESTVAEAADRLGVPRYPAAERLRRQAKRATLSTRWRPSLRIDPDSLDDYLAYLYAHRTTPNGAFSVKVHWNHFAELCERGLRLEDLPQPISWVHISRRDLIAQAVSFARAGRTGQWNTARTPDRYRALSLEYDDAAIERCHRHLAEAAAQWPRFFERSGITPISVVYEDLDAEYESTVRRTLDALGIHVDEVAEPALRRQRDETNDDWIRRFSENHPDLVGT
jgi:LPS sulfotransferase NodH